MKVYFWLFLTLASLCKAQNYDKGEFENFNRLFSFQNIITIDDELVVLGDISKIRKIEDSGNIFLILDSKASKLYLINLNQKKKHEINISKEFPGYNFVPDDIDTDSSGFWVSCYTGNGELFHFDKDGKLLHSYWLARDGYSFTNFLALNTRKILIEDRVPSGEIRLSLFDTNTSESNLLHTLKSKFPHAVFRYRVGGKAKSENEIFYSNGIEKIIYHFEPNGELNQFEIDKTFGFNGIQEDISSDVQAFFLTLKSKPDFDKILSIFNLNQELLLVNFLKNSHSHIALIDKMTHGTVNKELVKLPGALVYCHKNLIYLSVQENRMNDSGVLVNPSLLIFKLRTEGI